MIGEFVPADFARKLELNRNRTKELVEDYERDKKSLAVALGTDPVHVFMAREIIALQEEAAQWRAHARVFVPNNRPQDGRICQCEDAPCCGHYES
jgi:hypothetical protein